MPKNDQLPHEKYTKKKTKECEPEKKCRKKSGEELKVDARIKLNKNV